jgi:hypothetical protein
VPVNCAPAAAVKLKVALARSRDVELPPSETVKPPDVTFVI